MKQETIRTQHTRDDLEMISQRLASIKKRHSELKRPKAGDALALDHLSALIAHVEKVRAEMVQPELNFGSAA